jgi:hypothetical protein
MKSPRYSTLLEHGIFAGFDQGSEVYPFRGDVSRLPTDGAEKSVYLAE